MVNKLPQIKKRLSSQEMCFEKEGVYRLHVMIDDINPYVEDNWWVVDLKLIEYKYATEVNKESVMVDALLVPITSIQNLFHYYIHNGLYDIVKHYGIDRFTYRLSK